jgi:hypothetical protein
MKNVFFALLFLPSMLVAQEYSEVVEVSGKNADQLYASAKVWFAETFRSAQDVIQMDDQKSGTIIGKGILSTSNDLMVGVNSEMVIRFVVKIMVKDNRYKYDMYDFLVSQSQNGEPITKDVPMSQYINQKEYFKNGSDPDWLRKNGVKSYVKLTAANNATFYYHICKFENDIVLLQESLKKTMSVSDDW